jgi:hypothetical protein
MRKPFLPWSSCLTHSFFQAGQVGESEAAVVPANEQSKTVLHEQHHLLDDAARLADLVGVAFAVTRGPCHCFLFVLIVACPVFDGMWIAPRAARQCAD